MTERVRLRRPLAVFAVVLAATLGLWWALVAQEHDQVTGAVRLQANGAVEELASRLDARLLALEHMAQRWEEQGRPSRDHWRADAIRNLSAFPGFQAIEWVDPGFRIRWVYPSQGNEAARGLDLGAGGRRLAVLRMALDSGLLAATTAVDLVQGDKGFLAAAPIRRGPRFDGFILGVFRYRALFDVLLDDRIAPGFAIRVYDGDEPVYERSESGADSEGGWAWDTTLHVRGVAWRLRVAPGSAWLAERESHLAAAVLAFGLVTALLLSLTVGLAGTALARSRQAEAALARLEEEGAARAAVEAALRASEHRYRLLVEQGEGLMCTHDLDGVLLSVNPAAARALGYRPDEMIGRTLRDLLVPDAQPLFEGYLREIRENPTASGLMRMMTKDGRERVWAYHNSKPGDEGHPPCVLGHAQDVTERQAQSDALQYRATHDALTDLPNRFLFRDRLDQTLLLVQRQHQSLAVLLLDLNRFKTINDTRGHLVGDRLLQAVAGRLRQAVRASDTVGRLGGDEFAVLLSSTDIDGATLVASKIVEAVSQPFAIDGALLSVGVSVGIACFPDHGTRAEQLLGASDRAMYTAKSAATGLAVAAAEPTPPV